MLSSKRRFTRPAHVFGPVARTFIMTFAVAAAGCSADITRFGFNGGGYTTSSIPTPPEPIGGGYSHNATPRGLGVAEAPLPPVSDTGGNYRVAGRTYDAPPPSTYSPPSYSPPSSYSGPSREAAVPQPTSYQPAPQEPPGNYRVVGRQYKTPPPPAVQSEGPPRIAALTPAPIPQPSSHQAAGGQSIVVQQGETLYSIGRRYGVSAAALKEANGLSSNIVRPGERLVLPSAAEGRQSLAALPPPQRVPAPALTPASPTADRDSPPRVAAADTSAEPAAPAPPGWSGRHTLRNGESLYGVALKHNVSLDELQRANGITDPTKVWAGTVLNVPGHSSSEPASEPTRETAPRIVQVAPRIINAQPEAEPAPERKVASRSDIANDAGPSGAADMTAGKFRWPVRGKVIAGFGRRSDGTHNDGVNVAVPHGTEVHAADSGKVVYAGNELKGYGNLVLIRHPNGYVTAYAHADRLLVKANDEVRRGQVIATAGRTGAVDQPQLHFELRQGSKPIDPLPHLGG